MNTKKDFVSKIGNKNVKTEYENINIILNSNQYEYFPLKLKGTEIKKLENPNLYQLQIPSIDGETLYNIFNQYKAISYKTERTLQSFNKIPITVTQFNTLISLIIVFFFKVKYMNENNIYHNNINEENIILSRDYNLYLINFSRVTTKEIPKNDNNYYPDLPQIIILIEQCLWYGCENPILYNWFVTEFKFPNVPFCPNDNLGNTITQFINTNINKLNLLTFNPEIIMQNMNKFY